MMRGNAYHNNPNINFSFYFHIQTIAQVNFCKISTKVIKMKNHMCISTNLL